MTPLPFAPTCFGCGGHLEMMILISEGCVGAADIVCSKLLTTRVGKMSTLSLDLRLVVQNDIQQ
jgi:hypothetical protein